MGEELFIWTMTGSLLPHVELEAELIVLGWDETPKCDCISTLSTLLITHAHTHKRSLPVNKKNAGVQRAGRRRAAVTLSEKTSGNWE